ncbi:MAG TPA: glutaredoxin domain-containing protein [Terriglobales bacterium]|nr:glutaredoxin domain-containing protein [Terriglobales bacterium]
MEVIVYTSASCSACRTVKEFLSMHHVDFEERSLQQPEHLEELGEKYGAYSAPSVVVDGELVEGGLPEIAAAVGVEL